jgi:hypothetical protein
MKCTTRKEIKRITNNATRQFVFFSSRTRETKEKCNHSFRQKISEEETIGRSRWRLKNVIKFVLKETRHDRANCIHLP